MFKVGDIIEMTSTCGELKRGERFKLISYRGELFADLDMPHAGCSCKIKWKLVKKPIKQFGIVKFCEENRK